MSYSPPCPCEIRCKCFFHDSLTNNVIFVKQEDCDCCCESCHLRDKREREWTWWYKKKRRLQRTFLKKISLKYTHKTFPIGSRTPILKNFRLILTPNFLQNEKNRFYPASIDVDFHF